jgi:hypothetical protein
LPQQVHRVLQVVLGRRRHADLIALDRGLHLLELRVLDRGGDLLGRVRVERSLELDLARDAVAARGLDVADVQVLDRDPALDEPPWTTSRSDFIWNSESAARFSRASVRLNSIVALEPLKSYRCAISFCAWFTALSTSWRSTPVVTSKE